jgi:hypothetical protein
MLLFVEPTGVPERDPRGFAEMTKFAGELASKGKLRRGAPLGAASAGARVRVRDGKALVTDGPFAETKELVAGYWIWQVRSLDEAVEWARRCPNPMPGPSDLEIRPLWEAEDFGPEIAAGVEAQREKLAKRS